MENLIKCIKCTVHDGKQKDYLYIDKKTFQVLCKFCIEEGVTPKRKNLVFIENDSKKEEFRHCKVHEEEENLFYCEDCAEFICKICFCQTHRNHSCATPSLIIPSIQQNANNLYNQLSSLKLRIDESTDSIQKINTFFNNNKAEFQSNLRNVNEKINHSLDEKAQEYSNEIESFFNGVDSELELNIQKLENNRKKADRMLGEFNEMSNTIKEINNDKKICLYKKEKNDTILENKKFLTDIENFLKENLIKMKEKVAQTEETFNTKIANLKRNISNYENSVVNTIVSGIPNVCMRIRRFRRYTSSKSKYFKTDSLCMLTSNSVNLAGFAFCGLIEHLNKADLSYKVSLKIYELENVQNFDLNLSPLVDTEIDIPVITNIIDPVYQFYLKNSVTISKNKFYYIIIKNLSNQTFINTWTGSVGADLDDNINQHSVICNNSVVKFNFLNAFGVESDFNEFNDGIISDVIFSQID